MTAYRGREASWTNDGDSHETWFADLSFQLTTGSCSYGPFCGISTNVTDDASC